MASSNLLGKGDVKKDSAEACKSGVPLEHAFRDVDGVYLNYGYPEQNVRSALSYKPLDGDVFVASYPKCGTTWLQHIVYSIYRDGMSPGNILEFLSTTPFLEFMGADAVRTMPRPGAIKTHLPFNKVPYSTNAKYFYITRNPYDCSVSLFYHMKNSPPHLLENGTFGQSFEMFVEGKVDYGDYFDHVLSWYEHRADSNVLFLTYENLKKDARAWVLKIADFLGKEEYGDKLRQRPDIFDKVLDTVSFDTMREFYSGLNGWSKDFTSIPMEAIPEAMRSVMQTLGALFKKPITGDFVRKGIVGDWRNHFSSEQIARMKKRIALKTTGSDVMSLWEDSDLP
ncbi:sulfotransferase 1C2-like [Amblyomma americanum]